MSFIIRGQTPATAAARIELGGPLNSREGFRILRFEVFPSDITANAVAIGNLVRGNAIAAPTPNFGNKREVAWAACYINLDVLVGLSVSEISRIDYQVVLMELCHISVDESIGGMPVNWLLELERVELSAGELAYWNQRAASIRV